MSVRRSKWRSRCAIVRRNHSCLCFQHSISFFFIPFSARVCPGLMWVFATATTTRSSTNYLMSIFQLINCKCSSGFDSDAGRRQMLCRSPQVSFLLLIAIHCSSACHFCTIFFFSTFNLCTLIITKTGSLSLFSTKWIRIMNFPQTRVALIQPEMHSQFTVKLPTVFTHHIISGGFHHNRFRTIIYNRAKEICWPKWQRWLNKNNLKYAAEWQKHTLAHTHKQSTCLPSKIRYKYFIMEIHSTDPPLKMKHASEEVENQIWNEFTAKRRSSGIETKSRREREDEANEKVNNWTWLGFGLGRSSLAMALPFLCSIRFRLLLFSYAFDAFHAANGLLLWSSVWRALLCSWNFCFHIIFFIFVLTTDDDDDGTSPLSTISSSSISFRAIYETWTWQ